MYLFAEMARALLELHQRKVNHSFINLENFMVDLDGKVLITHRSITLKVFYLSPEFRLDRLTSPANDWFSMGVCLFKLLYGIFPFNAKTLDEFL